MATINKAEVIKKIIEGLRLDTGKDKIPKEVTEKVLPVFNVNANSRIITKIDNELNKNDKSFTVPENKQWKILSGWFELSATATVGSRILGFHINDENGEELLEIQPLNNQAASQTERYMLSTGDVTESTAGQHFYPYPPNLWLKPNQVINILDRANIDANDDLKVHLQIEEKDYFEQ